MTRNCFIFRMRKEATHKHIQLAVQERQKVSFVFQSLWMVCCLACDDIPIFRSAGGILHYVTIKKCVTQDFSNIHSVWIHGWRSLFCCDWAVFFKNSSLTSPAVKIRWLMIFLCASRVSAMWYLDFYVWECSKNCNFLPSFSAFFVVHLLERSHIKKLAEVTRWL